MELAAILALISIGGEIAKLATQISIIAHQEGRITAEQLEFVKAEAAISDDAWDEYVKKVFG